MAWRGVCVCVVVLLLLKLVLCGVLWEWEGGTRSSHTATSVKYGVLVGSNVRRRHA